MSDSEDESDVDFSASEDDFVPTDNDDSEESDEIEESQDSDQNEQSDESDVEEEIANKRLQGSIPKRIAKSTKTKLNKRKVTEDDDDSDSSVENYLVNPNEIDLASDFFTSHPNTAPNIPPTFDCNIGVSLSDSEEEVFEEIPSTSKPLDFNAHENFNKQLESAKEHLKNYKSTNIGHDNNENDVNKLLAIGETSSAATTSSSVHKKRKKDLNGSDESDWEEVAGESKVETKKDVEIRIGPTIKPKLNKRQAEIEASIKRKINLRKKENQLAMHKVHLLSWIAYGNFVNKVLNSTELMEMVVKFIPSEKCYPKSQTDINYFEQIIKWYKTVIGLKSKEQNCSLERLPPIASSLALQIQSKAAICKKDFVFIFVILLRSMGIQCRLVINLATVPIRPSAKELCVISMKDSDQKTAATKAADKSSTKKSSVDSKSKKESSKTLKSTKSTKSQSKADDDKSRSKITKSKSQDIPSTSATILKKGAEASKSIKDLKLKLDEAVKTTEKNETTDFNGKKAKRRSLSLNNSSPVAVKPKRTRISTLNDDQSDGSMFSKNTSNNVNIFSSPIARHTRSRGVKSDKSSNAILVANRKIPQLDGGDDKKTKKQKPKLFKLKLPFRSTSVSRSPSPSAATISQPTKSTATAEPTKKTITKSESVSKSASTSAQNEGKRSKEKPQLYKLRLPLRSRSVSKSTAQSTSKSMSRRSKSTSTVKSTTKNASPVKSAPTTTTKIASKPSSTSTTRSATIRKKLSSETKTMLSSSQPTSSASTATSATKAAVTSKAAVTTKVALITKKAIKKVADKRRSLENVSSDSDFAPTPKKVVKFSSSPTKPLPKQVEKLKKRIDRRVLSTDDESTEPSVKKYDMNYWIEVFCEAEQKWVCIDLFKLKVNSIDDVKKSATKPIAYVLAWNNNNTIKDVSSRYCTNWNTTTRKLRVDIEWMNETLMRYKEPNTARSRAEDNELNKIHLKEPLPKSISEFKNHPLYALKRHLLKFEGIYPPDAVTCGFIRDEGIYLRGCVHTLHSREIWVKQARVVKPAESPYKIVKARPKWDRLANKMLEPQPLEIFGRWQTQPYIPPTAENGVVPRNAYGNVELFRPEMLPKKTVHLRLAGLNRVCSKLKIDCAQAVVGFDFHGGSSHPTFDGFVVCEEFAELVTAQWVEDQEEIERKAEQKRTQRVYDNWKKLIKGLFIRERLQRKYNFAGKDVSSSKK